MRRKRSENNQEYTENRFEKTSVDNGFYKGKSEEQPLFQDGPSLESLHVQKTERHQAPVGRGKETSDPREKAALLGILKSIIVILLLMILFFMLWKGSKLYEERDRIEGAPISRETALIEEFDIKNQDAREFFVERIEIWKEAERLVRSADTLLKRNNFDRALSQCQDAVRISPFHTGALERLAELFFEKNMIEESINSYIRLLSIDSSRTDFLVKLIKALDAYGDAPAVVYMAQWFLEENHYNEEIQYYLANAFFAQEDYVNAVDAFGRVLKDSPRDVLVLEKLGSAHINLKEYAKALTVFEQLRESHYRDQNYYYKITVCNAQLGKSKETVQTLGKAAHLFGQNLVVKWIKDPLLDPVRKDESFLEFSDRVGGEEFRMWMEQIAKTIDVKEREDIAPQLILPDAGKLHSDLLTPQK